MRRLPELAEQAWGRGDPVAACRQSVHAANLINNTRSKGWGELEQTYWKTVIRFCKEAITTLADDVRDLCSKARVKIL